MTLEVTGCNDCPFFKIQSNEEDYSTYCNHLSHKTLTNKDIDVKGLLTPITPVWCPIEVDNVVI